MLSFLFLHVFLDILGNSSRVSTHFFGLFLRMRDFCFKNLCVCVFLCRALMEHNPGAVILSTDDYFTCTGYYQFDPSALGEAHEWNHKRGKDRVLPRVYAAVAI